MKVLLLGATGRTGALVLDEILLRGFDVTCLVREPKKIKATSTRMQVLMGSPQSLEDLGNALKGCQSIINVLNISRQFDFPWSSLRTPKNFLSDVMSKLIPLAESNEVKRMIVCSAWGVAETRSQLPGWFRWLADNSNIGVAYKDHERQEAMLRNSALKWTIVRPTGLTNSRRSQNIIETFDNAPRPSLTISRGAVARYLVEAIAEDRLVNKLPVISAG